MFKRSGVWWTCIRHNGKKIQKSLETADKKLAQNIESKIRIEIVEGRYFEKSVGHNKTFIQLMEKFMAEHAPKVSSSMQKSYATSLKHLIDFFGDTNMLSVSTKMVSRYKVLRKNEGMKPASINRELAMLSKAFNVAVREWEWLTDNPVSRVPKEKENNERDRWLTVDEEVRLLNNSSDLLKDIILFNLHTGLRQDELLSLTWDRVDLFRKTILIKVTKNGKPRTVPLNKTALEILVRKAKIIHISSQIVFHNKCGKKIDKHGLRRKFVVAMERAEIEDFTFHALRHTFATRLAQSGVDLYKISKLLGHKDIKTTQRYAHHCPDSLRSGVEILEVDYDLTTVDKKVALSGGEICPKSLVNKVRPVGIEPTAH
ncbi:MAG: tyrosine-type recombinase/integrase [Colwellia sp.]|nr:tyrosine-type recombinase/integrase [Colwellia sp.]